MSGKGSKQRPTDKAKFNSSWDRIFAVPQKWVTRDELKEMLEPTKGEKDESKQDNQK
jgi:hypothetical protein